MKKSLPTYLQNTLNYIVKYEKKYHKSPTHSEIAKFLGITTSTISHYVAKLLGKKEIKIDKKKWSRRIIVKK